MKAVFADSYHFLALLNEDDPGHPRAVIEHRRAWQTIVTTDCVLLETGDALCEPADHDDFLSLYATLRADRRVKFVRLTPTLLERGIERFRDRPDKDWPLTDCISFLVMEDERIRDALTADRHFEQAGFNALLK
jgi:predicted nucleic acid-binding protein